MPTYGWQLLTFVSGSKTGPLYKQLGMTSDKFGERIVLNCDWRYWINGAVQPTTGRLAELHVPHERVAGGMQLKITI